MIDHIYEVHFLFPVEFVDEKVPFPQLRLPEIPGIGDTLSFEELANGDGRYPCFIVANRYFHLRDGTISVVTLSLVLGDLKEIVVQQTS